MRKILFLAAFSLAALDCSGSNSSDGGQGGGSATGGGLATGGGAATGGGSATGGGTSDGGGGIGGGTGGGGGGGTVTCHYQRNVMGTDAGSPLSGGDCLVQAAISNNPAGIGFSVRDSQSAMTFSFAGTIIGATSFTAGTYTLTDIPKGGGVIDLCVAICNNDNCTDGASNVIPNYGTFTIHVTDPGPAQMGVLWSASHGDATLNLIAVPGTPCSGTDTVSITW